MTSSPHPLRIFPTIRRWWSESAARQGRLSATGALLGAMWQFIRDSTPARLRQRYGDADYDWDYRVNTTSAAVGWRDRLLGIFHSPYQPTDPALFHEMIDALRTDTGLNFKEFTFIDFGSGKGRTLLMASDYPFCRIIGVELLAALHQIAQENLREYKNESQKCFAIEAICADATIFPIPDHPLLMYLFNPFPESGLRRMITNLEQSLVARRRTVYVLYHNSLLEHVLTGSRILRKIGGTDQYSVFRNQ